jgi:uncharacterized protein (DUF433 family)
MIVMKKTDLIEIRQRTTGKSAYVGRSRIRVLNIVTLSEQLQSETLVDRIRLSYPQLTAEQVEAALEYARRHADEIERERAEEEAAYARLDSAV